MMQQRSTLSFLFLLASACGSVQDTAPSDGFLRSSIAADSDEARAILAVVNDPQITFIVLDGTVGLDRRAARNIAVYRNGEDGLANTADDQQYTDFETLDATRYVGDRALELLLEYARDNGYLGGQTSGDIRARIILSVVNDVHLTMVLLDDIIGLDRRAAASIIAFRADGFFADLAELDAQPWVGEHALDKLYEYGLSLGGTSAIETVFSPQPHVMSHNVRIAGLIDAAQSSIDVAIYSFSDESVFDALERAVVRGVRVRAIFETANADRRLSGTAFENSRSARLERMGINVRWVNKIMHHKFLLIDGPRDDIAAANTATIVSGSGNWSYSAATRYDENTLFITGETELALRYQREMNLLWAHSRDLVYDATLPFTQSTIAITDADIIDDPDTHVAFTSDNFSVSGDTFRIQRGLNTVSDQLVTAIQNATHSIWIASGHLRSRPIAEAILDKHRDDPSVDIRVYLDGQEFISAGYHQTQEAELEACVVAAGTSESRRSDCLDRGFYFGYQLGVSGIDVRYKHYAFRWHYSYAVQMHHKVLIIDGDELWTGSYNLSDNAEHNTFENMMMFRGPRHAAVVQSYAENFAALWETSRVDGTYAALLGRVNASNMIPLVYTPMALTHEEVTVLKAAIRENCAAIDSAPFREAPESHRVCAR